MILCDTSVLIDNLRKNVSLMNFLTTHSTESLFTTEISVMELYFGIYANPYFTEHPHLRETRIRTIEDLLHHFIVLPFDRNAAMKTSQIMGILQLSGQMIDFRDGMIAGISLANNITQFITRNLVHFKRIPELKIIEY